MDFPQALYKGSVADWAEASEAIRTNSPRVQQLIVYNQADFDAAIADGYGNAANLILPPAAPIPRPTLSVKKGE